ncbi:MAG: MBL fold metallo-hydrolase [Actinobacteria bacterium]|nr:MBL fold metallo-hydrolase [Actinomycetota bacterium]
MSFVATILGSSGVFATVDRASSGYLVDVDGHPLWMDAGAGTWRNLLGHLDYPELEGVILTHRHPDHTSDIWQAVHAFQWGQKEQLAPIPLWTTREAMAALSAFSTDLGNVFDLRPVGPGDVVSFAGAEISFFEMKHIPGTVGVRIEYAGKTLAYSADAGPSGNLPELAANADVFICEATYLKDEAGDWDGHLNAAQAARVAQDAGAKRLVLTHLHPKKDHGRSLNEAQAVAPGLRVELAYDGLRMEVDA